MAFNTLFLSELSNLSAAETAERLREFVASAPSLNGELQELDKAISDYETRYEMSSPKMLEGVRENRLEHTADTCRWAMLLEMRERVRKACE